MPTVEKWFPFLNPTTGDFIIPLQGWLSQPCAGINCLEKKNYHLLSWSAKSIGCLRLNSQSSSKFSSGQTRPHPRLRRFVSRPQKKRSEAFYLINRTHYRVTANRRPKIGKGELTPPSADMYVIQTQTANKTKTNKQKSPILPTTTETPVSESSIS